MVAHCIRLSRAGLGKIGKSLLVITVVSEMSEIYGGALETIGELQEVGEHVVYIITRSFPHCILV